MRIIIPFLLTSCCAFAEPAWKSDLSPAKPSHHAPITSSTLDFTLSWKGMVKAGVLRMEFAPKDAKKPGAFVTKCSASSVGPAAKLFPFTHRSWSEIHPVTLSSSYYHATENDAKENIVTINRYSSSHVNIREVTTDADTGVKKTETISFPHGPARDVISAMLYIRSQKLAIGEEHTLLLLPFKTPYILYVKVEAKEKHLGRDALRIRFNLRKIDRNTLALGSYKKIKKPVTLWLSDDADRVPIELRASAYIGDVRAVLTKFSKNP